MTNAAVENAAVALRLGMLGLPIPDEAEHSLASELVRPLLERQREFDRRLSQTLPFADQRIQNFLDSYLEGTDTAPQMPTSTLVLDDAGLARTLSLPVDADEFHSEHLASYRVANGVLHNPANDRRTTKGVFHIAEGGLPIQDDKIAVPRATFGRLVELAFQAPEDALVLPWGANLSTPPKSWVSLLLRPTVVPEVPGFCTKRTMEVRFFAPGTLVANLDFVEGIFGNAGDPYLPDNDAALDPEAWTGHTGCVVLAPHLTKVTKKSVGLPHVSEATERQKRDGMCWESEDELYNDGKAFKACARDERGVIVTVIADNYFGYCKKEVKTQIGYAANLLDLVEEEHAGGATCYPSYNLGQRYTDNHADPSYTLEAVLEANPGRFELQPEGHAIDTVLDKVVLVPRESTYSLRDSTVSWKVNGEKRSIPLHAETDYFGPDGYRVRLRHLEVDGDQWSLIGTSPRATTLHKPATVSGGGKSEISKAITDAFITGNAYIANFDEDMATVREILEHDYSNRFRDPERNGHDARPVLSDRRSVGSVIKLLTPSSEYNDEYNAWLEAIPHPIKEIVFVVKRFYQPEWGDDWASHFSVGRINGRKGTSLRLDGQKIHVNMLRVGFEPDGSWRLFGLRHDFQPSTKVQTEDDITASIVVPGEYAGHPTSRKFVANCEALLFQRPDDAIHRGYDKQTELDMAQPGTFLSNFQPLTQDDARAMVSDAIAFSTFSAPMEEFIKGFAEGQPGQPTFFVSSANPRLVDGKPSKNPRYLQVRPDIARPRTPQLADIAAHLTRKLPLDQPLALPVDVVAAGRRNNAAEPGVPPLCTYSPLHYMELPELFMEFISSMTGKSPSTTGAGSEGAMTKAPFNCLPSAIDLNSAFLSFALTGYDGWLSSAGVIGPKVRVDHDISLLVPEVFSRMEPHEWDAQALIAEGALEKIEDFEHNGQLVQASRLGYRMTEKFATRYFGRIFLHPHVVFTEEMLRPELQDADVFAESMATIVTTHQRVAQSYLDDGTVELAVPPIRALLEIMATGRSREGWDLHTPDFRATFSRESVLASDWYAERLEAQGKLAREHVSRAASRIDAFSAEQTQVATAERLGLAERRSRVEAQLARQPKMEGTLGRQVHWRLDA